MAEGVTLVAPDTVHLSFDTEIAGGALIEPYVVFGAKVRIEGGAVVRSFTHIDHAVVRACATVGPFARLRPGADIGPRAHVGNFVEVKNVKVGEGAKLNHLTYVGDGTIGPRANLGAGTIFCNYDGFDKYQTHVGADAFIGSDTALVAPVTVGDGAYTGSGSVITEDVPPGALALGRSRQVIKDGWATQFRARKQANRKPK
jgi:bifunctional UDP-N-acetylglucosamine pyrophosphorylase/glucosamine-1-phosphate N-acetyltransferase